jgi:hypothetical protein
MGTGSRSPKGNETLIGLEYEFAREQAYNLGRMGRKLEAALAALAAFDAEQPGGKAPVGKARTHRAALVAAAGTALWHFVIQREACGLRDSRQIVRDYRVPAEVIARMGIVR